MSDQTVNRDAGSGRFVSAEYAEAHPDTTVSDHIPAPAVDELADNLAYMERRTESRGSWTLVQVPGIRITGTDPTEMSWSARRQLDEILGDEEIER